MNPLNKLTKERTMLNIKEAVARSRKLLVETYDKIDKDINKQISDFIESQHTDRRFFVFECTGFDNIVLVYDRVYDGVSGELEVSIDEHEVTLFGSKYDDLPDEEIKHIKLLFSNVMSFLSELNDFYVEDNYNMTLEDTRPYDHVTDRMVLVYDKQKNKHVTRPYAI